MLTNVLSLKYEMAALYNCVNCLFEGLLNEKATFSFVIILLYFCQKNLCLQSMLSPFSSRIRGLSNCQHRTVVEMLLCFLLLV